jgi:hypothetical protein
VRSNADPESPGRGTTFLLRLPIAAGTANGTRPATARLSSGAAIRMETKESA